MAFRTRILVPYKINKFAKNISKGIINDTDEEGKN